jgi:hypothetical protein
MHLTPEQKRVAKTIINTGKRVGASPKDIVTALATGLVEANLGNPASGDGTSVGWRQETSSSYPNVNRRNVKESAERFYSELKSAGSGSIGQRAQAVQRSAYPGRYGERVGEARAILKQLNRGGVRAVAASPQTAAQPASAGSAKLTIPGKSYAQQRKLAALDFIKNRFQPGEFQQYQVQKEQLKDIPSQLLQLGRKATPPSKLKQEKTQAGLGTSEHLSGGAIEIGKEVAKKFGLTVTSTTGGTHVAGSYHYQGRAIDIAGAPAAMKAAFKYIQKNLPHHKLTELFYDPIGHYWDNGQKVHGAIGEHSDHVHLAI